MLPFLRVGPLLIQLPGLALIAGFWIGTNLIEKEAPRFKLNTDAVLKLVTYATIAALLGARLFYAALHATAYMQSPLGLLSIDATTLDPVGGLLCGLITAYLVGSRATLPLRETLDALTPGFAAIMIAVGVAHILSGNAYGAPANLPWSIELWGAARHPSQIYETLGALGVFVAWRLGPASPPGFSFLRWLLLQTLVSILLETFRGDSAILPGGFRAAQVLGVVILAAAVYLAYAWRSKQAA
jgi:phosphatidylglycerol:prolipoprotein diacylglycerol transferase